MKVISVSTLFGFAFSLIATVCFAKISESPPRLGSIQAKKGGTFFYELAVAPVTLNPITASDNYSTFVEPWIFETLLSRHEDTLQWVPRLALDYTEAADHLSVSFKLRSGVRFHDGQLLSADDVKFSVDVYSSGLYKTAIDQAYLSNIKSVEIVNPLEVRFVFIKPLYDNIDTVASIPIVPRSIYGDKTQIAKLSKVAIGTGPYKLKSYDLNQQLVLETNPDWWGKKVDLFKYKYNFDRITVRFLRERNQKIMSLEKGDLDFSLLTTDEFLQDTGSPVWGKKVIAEHVTSVGHAPGMDAVWWNLRRAIFKSSRTREALQLLLNRKWVNDHMFGGRPALCTGPWHRSSEYADSNLKPIEYDPGQALKLLTSDGWRRDDSNGLLYKNIEGNRTEFRFSLLIPARDQEKYFVGYQSDLKKVGITMDIQFIDWTTFIKRLDDLDFDAHFVGHGSAHTIDFNPKPEWSSSFTAKGSSNTTGYSNRKVDSLLDRAEFEHDRGSRIQLLRQTYKLIAADFPILLWVCNSERLYAHSSRMRMERPTYKHDLGIDYWWIEP